MRMCSSMKARRCAGMSSGRRVGTMAILSGCEFRTCWIASMRRCFAARAGARFWQKMAVYGRCQQLNAGSGALAWDGVELAAFCAAGPRCGSAIRLDFLGAWPFRCENARQGMLDFLGFPWILSSESRLFNGLRGQKRRKFFSALFRGLSRAGTAPTVSGMRKRRIAHTGKLNSDF